MKYILCVSYIFLSSCVCYGLNKSHTNDKPLTLDQLIKEVVERNPSLAAVNARVRAATFVIDRVQTPSDPQFTWMTDNNPFSSPKTGIFPDTSYQLSQTFPFPGKLNLKGKIAEQQFSAICYEKITTQKELILQTKKLYYQLSLNYFARDINKKNRKIVSSFIKGALALYKTGKADQADVFKAQVEYQILKNELLTLKSEQVALESMINAFMNRSPTNPIGKPIEFFHEKLNLSYEALAKQAMSERSELHGMNAMIKEQKTMSKLSKLELFPDVTVSGVIHDMKMPEKHDHEWGIGVSFNIPLFYSKRQRRESQEAEAKAIAHQNTRDAMRAMICSQIKEILARIRFAEKSIILYEKSLIPKTMKTLSASQEKYRVGKGGFLFLLDTRRQLQNFQLAYEQVRIEREILLAGLERAIGVPLERVRCLVGENYAK